VVKLQYETKDKFRIGKDVAVGVLRFKRAMETMAEENEVDRFYSFHVYRKGEELFTLHFQSELETAVKTSRPEMSFFEEMEFIKQPGYVFVQEFPDGSTGRRFDYLKSKTREEEARFEGDEKRTELYRIVDDGPKSTGVDSTYVKFFEKTQKASGWDDSMYIEWIDITYLDIKANAIEIIESLLSSE
jgi:hypothetical protein